MKFIIAIVTMLFLGGQAQAYSYAAAGKEPLIDGREAILAAVTAKDWAAASKAAASIKTDLAYLTEHHDSSLQKSLDEALGKQNAPAVSAALRRTFAAEMERRLDGAEKNLGDYQAARVLLVKCKRFFDAISGELAPPKRLAGEDALGRALAAIGNPGVFGAGRRPADPAAFQAARKDVNAALAP